MQAKRLVIFFSILLLASIPLSAQTLGGINGQVADSTGAVIPGATVTITNTDTTAVRTMSTNASGLYAAPGLTPGPYEVRVETAGFAAQARAVNIQVQQTARLDFQLEIGQVAESIEVTSEAALLDTSNVTVGTVIDNQRIVDLPLNGRNFLQLVSLSPNVTYGFGSQGNNSRQGGSRMNQNMSISGMRATLEPLHAGRCREYRSKLQHIRRPAFDGLPPGVQGPNRHLSGRVWPRRQPDQRFDQVRARTSSTVPPTGLMRNDKLSARSYAFEESQHDQEQKPQEHAEMESVRLHARRPSGIPKVLNGKDKLFFSVNWEGFRQRSSGTGTWTVPRQPHARREFLGTGCPNL